MKRFLVLLFAALVAASSSPASAGFLQNFGCWISGSNTACAKPVNVASGGTGLSTLTAHALQVGNGTSSVTQIGVGTNGQLLVGNTTADPGWSSTVSAATTFSGGVVFNGGGTNLNWYEEGTFSPTVACGTSGVVTYNIQNGSFTRIGKHVTAQFYISFNKNNCTGSLVIGGLPYASKNTSNYFQTCATSYIRGFTPPGTYGVANGNTFGGLIAYMNPNSTNVTLNWPAANTTMTAADASNLNGGTIEELMIGCPYNAN